MKEVWTLSVAQAALARGLSAIGSQWPEDLLRGVLPGGTLDSAGALEVYRVGYIVRLSDQLGEIYASVWRVLGDQDFFALCEAYIAGHPSSSYNLSDYGSGFALFLEAAPQVAEAPFLPELASFEWMFHQLFHAPAHVPVSVDELAALEDLDGVKLRLGAAVRVVDCAMAVYEVFRHRHAEGFPDLELERPQRVLMFKQDGDLLAREIDLATFAALDALMRGLPVNDALECAAACASGYSATQAQRLFELIARCGLVERVER